MFEKKIKKVLLIEDDPAMLKILQSHFPGENTEFSIAILPDEGIRKVGESLPDLVILDMMLPGKSGLEILNTIRANSKTKKIPVLVLSIVSEPNTIAKAKKLGIIDYIIKGTISLDELEKRIKDALQ